MNNITIEGIIGRDIEVKELNGYKVGKFSVADKTKDKTIWWDCSLWGERAEKLTQYLKKGTHVCVSGELSEWEGVDNKTGILKRKFTLRVNNLSFYSAKSKDKDEFIPDDLPF